MRLQGKIALVTGASKGIGRQISCFFAREGASLVVTGRNEADLQSLNEELMAKDATVAYYVADVTYKADIEGLVAFAKDKYGRIDILVNNAGQMFYGGITDITEEDWDKAMSVNLKSQFLCTQALVPIMQENGYGHIIHMSSTGGKSATTITGLNYAVSKAGIMYMTKRLANDLGKYGITVNCISPGTIDTAMSRSFSSEALAAFTKNIPIKRIGTTDDVANLAVFLASDESSYITGEVIDINGGSFID